MVTEIIKDKKLLDVLQKAIEFKAIKRKQKSYYYYREGFQTSNKIFATKFFSKIKSW